MRFTPLSECAVAPISSHVASHVFGRLPGLLERQGPGDVVRPRGGCPGPKQLVHGPLSFLPLKFAKAPNEAIQLLSPDRFSLGGARLVAMVVDDRHGTLRSAPERANYMPKVRSRLDGSRRGQRGERLPVFIRVRVAGERPRDGLIQELFLDSFTPGVGVHTFRLGEVRRRNHTLVAAMLKAPVPLNVEDLVIREPGFPIMRLELVTGGIADSIVDATGVLGKPRGDQPFTVGHSKELSPGLHEVQIPRLLVEVSDEQEKARPWPWPYTSTRKA